MAKLLVLFALSVAVYAAPQTKNDPHANWRIVGGSTATENQFNYVVSIKKNDTHLCGGSIVNEKWILTAAHCVIGLSTNSLGVVAGSAKLDGDGDSYKVNIVFCHDKYNPWTQENDIALLRTSTLIEFRVGVQPIELAQENVAVDSDAILCGWGAISYPQLYNPNELQFISLKTISYEQCDIKHKIPPVNPKHVCTFTQKGEGACQGDSGGPLVSGGKQIGVLSFGRPCAVGYPDVYSSVASYYEWIEYTMY